MSIVPGEGKQLEARRAHERDAEAISRINNQGIEDRLATFETRLRESKLRNLPPRFVV
jgi:hypothetical protein